MKFKQNKFSHTGGDFLKMTKNGSNKIFAKPTNNERPIFSWNRNIILCIILSMGKYIYAGLKKAIISNSIVLFF